MVEVAFTLILPHPHPDDIFHLQILLLVHLISAYPMFLNPPNQFLEKMIGIPPSEATGLAIIKIKITTTTTTTITITILPRVHNQEDRVPHIDHRLPSLPRRVVANILWDPSSRTRDA